MGFGDDLLARLGLTSDAGRRLSDLGPSSPGVEVRFERDGGALAETTGGHELELHATLDERHVPLAANAVALLRVMEADFLPGGGLDDPVVTLLGTGAAGAAPVRQLVTQVSDLPAGLSVRAFVEEVKRTLDAYEDTLLVVRCEPDVLGGRPGTRRTHLFAWHRVSNDDVNAASELYAIAELPGGRRAVSTVVSVTAAPAGVAVRLRGTLAGAPGVAVTLGGRAATTGDGGDFVVDARLPTGDHGLGFARSGMDPVSLTVRIAVAADGRATASVRRGAATLESATTAGVADETSRLDLDLAAPVPAVVHRLRGTVRWPDSPDPLPADHRGRPLANRRVHVLPGGERPATSRAWEALKRRPDVLRSAVTGADGAFEVPFVEWADGRSHLLWVERIAPDGTEAPDFLVRTFTTELIQITAPVLTAKPTADDLDAKDRLLVDHEETVLTGDAVPRGADVLTVADLGGLTVARALAGADPLPVPADRTVVGLELAVLPLAPVYEPADARGPAARAAADALAQAAADAFRNYDDIPPGNEVRRAGADTTAVRIVLDSAGLEADLALASRADRVALLESTFVVRPELGIAKLLRVDQARWHIDAVSLADTAFVELTAGTPDSSSRHLVGAVHPVLAASSPLLPALAGRTLFVGPGHGLWARNNDMSSGDPAHWTTDRGGYAANAGEDEIDALLAAQVARIVEGSAGRVVTSRELYDVTRTGVREAAASYPTVADPDFPRLWQQNAVYFLRTHASGANAAVGFKNSGGTNSRLAHIRANAARLDLIFFPHTNGLEGPAETEPGHPPGTAHSRRGTMVEYLNVRHGANASHSSGNPLGFGLASRLSARLEERLRIRNRGVLSMQQVKGAAVGDMISTFAHFRDGGAETSAADDRADSASATTPIAQPGLGAVRIPVALAEHAYHDNPVDAALLARAWFRRLAAEAAALACSAQLEATRTTVTSSDVRAVLARTFGHTAALAARPAVATVTPGTLAADLQAVASPTAVAPAGAGLGDVATAALLAARSFPRSALVEVIRDALRPVSGWEAGDAAAVVDFWVGGAATAGLDLGRPDAPATWEEAAALALTAIGATPATPATAVARGLLPAVGGGAYFPRVEADALADRLAALGPRSVHRLANARLVDERWAPLPTVPSGALVTPLLRTAGTAFKTVAQTTVNGGIDGAEIVVAAGGTRHRIAVMLRTPQLVAGASWAVDLAPGTHAVTLELRLRHARVGWLSIGTQTVTLTVT